MDRLACVEIPAPVDVVQLTEKLRRFTPGVEPCAEEPGIFWLDADGLAYLYPSLAEWGQAIHQQLGATVVIGFQRFGTYAVLKSRPRRDVTLFARPEEEAAAMRRVRLTRVGLPSETLYALEKLAVRTVGELLALPSVGILRRFGRPVYRLRQLAGGERHEPLQPAPIEDPVTWSLDLDHAESDFERLTFLIKRELDPLLARLAARGEALVELELTLDCAKLHPRKEHIRPAAPTLDAVQLLGLVRLRLESLRLASGVTRLSARALGTPATAEQLLLFAKKPRRDLSAAARALARVRAALGDRSVVRARLREGHLPEARYFWEPTFEVPAAQPREVAVRPLVRRIEARAAPLPSRPAREPDGWLLGGMQHGPVERVVGPQLVSGGWWQKQIDRDYYFAELRSGALYWVYYDRRRRRWFLQGQVA